jgi:putative FmdB family regulatory protein
MMALYEYKCDCGNSADISHPMDDSPKVICPKCLKNMRKGFGTPWIKFGGTGFYSTDKKNDR